MYQRIRTTSFMLLSVFSLCLLLLLTSTQHVLAATTENITAPAPTVAAQHAYLLDTNSWHTLFQKDDTTHAEIGSITKTMTAILVLQYGNLDQQVTIQQKYLDYVYEQEASSAGLAAGDKLTERELLYAMLLPSGCDAAYALAEAIAGSYDNFVQLMNTQTHYMGLNDTYFTSVDGLHIADGQGVYGYSTAAETVRVGAYAMSYPLFRDVVKSTSYSLPATTNHHSYGWTNTNSLLTTYPGAVGIKTGTTPWAGPCVLFAATRNGHTLVGVVLNSSSVNQRFTDAAAMLDWGFQQIANGSYLKTPTVQPVI